MSGHIFLSLSGANTIKIKHAPPTLPDKVLYELIKARWTEGFESYRREGPDWQITLKGQPWTCKDPRLAFQARRVVTLLFKLLGNSVCHSVLVFLGCSVEFIGLNEYLGSETVRDSS